MNYEPSANLVGLITGVIAATFDISDKDAQTHAYRLAALAEGWGDPRARTIDWNYTVKRHLGSSLKWQSDADRKQFELHREQVASAYENFIQQKRRF